MNGAKPSVPISKRRRGRLSRSTRLINWLGLRLKLARTVDGLCIFFCDGSDEGRRALSLIEEALHVIKAYDRPRYNRVLRDVKCIWVEFFRTNIARADCRHGMCMLSKEFIFSQAMPETTAQSIVHEATHMRIWNRGIDYEPELRGRIEQVCIRREIAFASKLPAGESRETLIASSQCSLKEYAANKEYFSDAAFRERRKKDELYRRDDFIKDTDELRKDGTPEWIVWGLVMLYSVTTSVARARLSFRRIRRRMSAS